ncbi:protein NLP6-like [Primulina eburnea]|uniref:protein NLP6-like n=1 Tax=Primulina eburnea TaxID=1245227 RepID=UPI003C6C37B8
MTGNDDFYRIIIPIEGCSDEYSSVLEFKEYLTAENLSSEVFRCGWVFWAPERDDQGGRSIREKIRRVLNRLMSSSYSLTYMVQFWASMEVGGRSILTTSDQPFAVMNCLRKVESWYRKKCTDHHYIVEDGAENEQLGPPGRVFRNGRPESSPDIRNYTVKEFPLRDHAANCGERSYLALPVFDLVHDHYVGVLEIVSDDYGADILSCGSDICRELEEVEMRTTHLDHWEQLIKDPLKQKYLINDDLLLYHNQQPSEIIEMLKLASNAIPQLHLAQVMAPCEQCGTSSKSFNCMKHVVSLVKKEDDGLLQNFFMASKFHNLQNGQGMGGFALSSVNKSLFCQNVSDLSISDYTTVHYAREGRLSLCFAICLRDMLHRENSDNDLYVFEFFLQPQSRDPTNIWFVLHLLLKLMEDTLRSFEVATGRHLAENLITDEIRRTYMPPSSISGQNDMFPSGIEVIPYGLKTVHQQHPILFSVPMEGCDESYSIFELREYLRNPNLHCVQEKGSEYGFSCYCTEDDDLLENGDYNDSVSEFISTPDQKIKILTGKLIPCWGPHNYLIQFWAPKMIKNRLYLSTSDHPFVLGHLGRGLCWYRRQCMEHLYHVGDGAKEEELGPPGRVFLTGHQESSLDLHLYSTREFPLLVHVIHCCARDYLVLPLFDVQQKYCFGVLECVGLPCCSLDFILDKLKEVDLRSTHVNYDRPSINIDNRRKLAVAEIEEMFQLLYWSAQLRLASAWMPCGQCATTNIEILCMERVCDIRLAAFGNMKFQKVNIGKRDLPVEC